MKKSFGTLNDVEFVFEAKEEFNPGDHIRLDFENKVIIKAKKHDRYYHARAPGYLAVGDFLVVKIEKVDIGVEINIRS